MSMNCEMEVKEEKPKQRRGGGGLTGGSCDTQTLTNLFYSEYGVAVIPPIVNRDLVVWEIERGRRPNSAYSLH